MNENDMRQIHLIGDYYMTVDSMSCNLTKRKIGQKGKNAGKESFSIIGYYPNAEMVLRRLAEELQKDRLEEANDIQDVIRIIKQSNDDVKGIIKKVGGLNE